MGVARKYSTEPDELGQPRFCAFTNRVDAWLHERAEEERRSLAWVIREIVTRAYEEERLSRRAS